MVLTTVTPMWDLLFSCDTVRLWKCNSAWEDDVSPYLTLCTLFYLVINVCMFVCLYVCMGVFIVDVGRDDRYQQGVKETASLKY